MQGDIAIVFDNSTGYGDFAMASGGLLTGYELETAILISLFTDAQADPGDVTYDTDPRGWWADTYAAVEDPTLPTISADRIGSKLWQVFSRPRDQQTLNWMRDQIVIALRWMLIDGVADQIEVAPQFTGSGGVGAVITLTKAGKVHRYDYAWAQETSAAPPGPTASFNNEFTGDFERAI